MICGLQVPLLTREQILKRLESQPYIMLPGWSEDQDRILQDLITEGVIRKATRRDIVGVEGYPFPVNEDFSFCLVNASGGNNAGE